MVEKAVLTPARTRRESCSPAPQGGMPAVAHSSLEQTPAPRSEEQQFNLIISSIYRLQVGTACSELTISLTIVHMGNFRPA